MSDWIKLRYLPLMSVYFFTGLSGLTAVSWLFFQKDVLTLTAAQLVAVGTWAGIPWSIKMLFGAFIDGVPIFGSRRRAYIIIGALLTALGILGGVDHASTQYLFTAIGEFQGTLLTMLVATLGVVISDIVADTYAVELAETDQDINRLQVLSRLSLSAGAIAAAALTGWLASILPFATVFAIELLCPLGIILAALLVKIPDPKQSAPLNRELILGSLLILEAFILCYMWSIGTWGLFLINLVILSFFLFRLLSQTQNRQMFISFCLAIIALFFLRLSPGVGAGLMWFQEGILGFDREFFGTLRVVAQVVSTITLFGLAAYFAKGKIFFSMAVIVGIGTLLNTPEILVYYGYHEALGISARTIMLADAAAGAPLGALSMIPLGILIARHAPAMQRATYIALTASFMNIPMMGGRVLTEWLNSRFVVTRTNFDQLGTLLLMSLGLGILMSILGLVFLWGSGRVQGDQDS